MSAAALLDELAVAGVRLVRAGGDLRYQTAPGVSIAPHTERIREAKPSLLRLLREREAIAGLEDQLEQGWQWLEAHPHHPEHEAFLDRWIARLREYEQTYAAHLEQGEALCRAS